MEIKCISIEGENAIILAKIFDYLCEKSDRCDALEKLLEAAKDVAYWDWSSNGSEPVAAMEKLKAQIDAL